VIAGTQGVRQPIEARLAAAGLPPLPRTAWLEIDLAAVADNLATLRSLAGTGVRVEPVVKADAYGHGAVPVAIALEAAGADGFSVATFDEAIELRAAGIEAPILVLYPIPPDLVPEAARRAIAVSTGEGQGLERLVAAAAATGAAGGPRLDVHLELETGLGRGGAMPDAAAGAAARLREAPGIRLAGCWSHLTAADDAAIARGQDERFEGLLDGIGIDDPPVRRHLSASGAIVGGTARGWDAVRPGLSVYGIVPDGLVIPEGLRTTAGQLRPAMALVARPVRVVDLPAGHGVSYGPAFVTARPSRIATLPLGYGDGWRRAFSDRTFALVRGARAPIVGRVAMDAVMVDVTDVPGPPVDEDDELVLLGTQGAERIEAAALARIADTISYEVTTAMARRVPRVYHRAGALLGVRALTGWTSVGPEPGDAPHVPDAALPART
jgi:alanine racemase